ncbi:MAG: hypothetical protein WCX93_02785 [Burkholderiaceae bacterium]
MINYNERVGTHAADSIWAINGDIVYAGPGDDEVFLSPFNHAYLIGGSGNDTYWLGIASYAVILDSSGHDTLVAPFHIDPLSTFAVTIDGGRHLLLGDISSETLILVEEIRNHPIETFSFNGFTTSQHGMEYVIRENGMHMGDVSYGQMEHLGLGSAVFWSKGMQAEIDHILTREREFFDPWPGNNHAPHPQPGPAPTPEPATSNIPSIDANWYLSQNPDIAASGVDPITHYMHWGWKEGRDPNRLFDTDWYLATNQDVAGAGVNPFEHYMLYGWKEGRDPSPSFDTSHYLDTHVDIALAGVNPLEHYLNWGIIEGREIAAVV